MLHRAILLAALSVPSVAFATTLLPDDSSSVKSLDGAWRFKLEQDVYPATGRVGSITPFAPPEHLLPFEKPEFSEDSTWKKITVPGNWEMAGFAPAVYGQPNNAIGLYRLEFKVPADWKGRTVKINFDGVQNGAEIYLNGQPVTVDESTGGKSNYHQGGDDAFQADLTPSVQFGKNNLLAIRVYKNPLGSDLDSGDFFFLGGIHRKVTLFAVPQTHLEDLSVKTKVLPDNSAQLDLTFAVPGDSSSTISAHLEGFPIVEGKCADGALHLTETLDHPKLWSSEHPNLYTLHIDLKDPSGKVIESVTKRIGVREVSIEGGVLMVNHVPVKFTGMCRHEIDPALGTALNDDIWRKDITMMKAANVNAIRTSHYPYGSGFYDLCDELGIYVMDEMAAGWVPTDKPALTPFFAQHARELVRRDKNHPSVVVWAIGNENKPGPSNKIAADEIRKLDDSRPRLVSWRNAEEGGVELDDRHYTDPPAIQKANDETERRKTYPIIYLENPNDWEARNGADWGCEDLFGMVMKHTWDTVWNADHVPGSFLWEWTDRAVADPNSKHLYDFYPKTGINIVKVKGQTDAFRNPRPTLFHVKMAYAPITVDLTPIVSDHTLTIHAQNKYSFTDLSELKTTWHLLSGEKELESGKEHPKLAPRSKGDLKFEISNPSAADSLRIEFDTIDGVNVATYLLRLKPAADTTPKIDSTDLSQLNFPRFNLVLPTYGPSPKTGWHMATHHRAGLTHITVAGKPVADEAALSKLPLASVSALDADVVLLDKPSSSFAKVHAAFDHGKFSYHLQWLADKSVVMDDDSKKGSKNKNTDVQELGWIFSVPSKYDHFSWNRQALWSWYPKDHIGRPSGTATPDTMDVDITKITRADAFDFNSTKYNCDNATLATSQGAGVAVLCDSGDRQQIRAGANADGSHQLVINKYTCPPRDLSSGVVPELYFTLTKGRAVDSSFTLGKVNP